MPTTFRPPLHRALAYRVLWTLLALLALSGHAAFGGQTADFSPHSMLDSLHADDLAQILEAAAPSQSTAPEQGSAKERGLAAERSTMPDRTAAQVRHLFVKALGQGATKQEAEQQALRNARELAAKYLAALGGAEALAPGDEAQRIVTMRHFPTLGFGAPRAVALVELRLRGHLPALERDTPLLVLRASIEAGVLLLAANRSCEAVAAYLPAPDAEPELLPGGVRPLRLSPGKPVRQALPPGLKSLDVLACTGGLALPANPSSLDEAFTKARPGRPRPFRVEGVVSNCVELRFPLSPSEQRSLRLKSSDSPEDMTGAAGHDSSLPLPPAP
ncbi:hypothetical protein [Humidesulfovibrio sp.]